MGKIKSFIIGAGIGALAALLLAPKTGEQMRAFVTEKANAAAGEAKDFASGMPGVAQDLVNTATGKVKGAAPAAAATQPDDELRAKIEAARQRIAAQVAENAAAAKAVEAAAE